MLAIQFAIKNLLRAGLRTWLNVSVLSVTFVIILFYNGLLDGWNRQAIRDTIAWETGQGQLWHSSYDPYDPFSLQDAHAQIPESLNSQVSNNILTPVIAIQATAYPQNRMLNVTLKGISSEQQIIQIKTYPMIDREGFIPVVIGKRTASAAGIKQGDTFMLRWRDKNGTFDARQVVVSEIFHCNVPAADQGIIWTDLETIYEMTGLSEHATYFVVSEQYHGGDVDTWKFRNNDYLLSELQKVMSAKKAGSSVMYLILLSIALLAVFDTQVLSIFRRQKEIGTLISMGMTRFQVVRIFTVEGTAHSILAILVSILWGTPLLWFLQIKGISMPSIADEAGLAISSEIIPYFGFGMIVSTILLVTVTSLIVSYLPSRKIAKLNPVEAIKGKLQ